MDNNRDYCSPEEEQNTANPYGNYNYGNQGYGGDPYAAYNATHNTTYSQQRYANLGGVMVDGNGKPLKNHFALKLTLSILMIIACCCCGPVISIFGILALVFACLANSSYNDGNPEQFRTRARVSSIMLWVGGGLFVVIMAIYVVGFSIFNKELRDALGEDIYSQLRDEEFWENLENLDDEEYWDKEYWEGIFGTEIFPDSENWDDYDPEIYEETLGDRTVRLVEGFDEITWNGVVYSVPLSYSDLTAMGIELIDFDSDVEFEAGTYEVYDFTLGNGFSGAVCVSNNSKTTLAATDCEMDYFNIYNESTADGADESPITFWGGLQFDCSYEDIEAYLGTPTHLYREVDENYGSWEEYEWEYIGLDEYQCIEVTFANGDLYDITISHYEY